MFCSFQEVQRGLVLYEWKTPLRMEVRKVILAADKMFTIEALSQRWLKKEIKSSIKINTEARKAHTDIFYVYSYNVGRVTTNIL